MQDSRMRCSHAALDAQRGSKPSVQLVASAQHGSNRRRCLTVANTLVGPDPRLATPDFFMTPSKALKGREVEEAAMWRCVKLQQECPNGRKLSMQKWEKKGLLQQAYSRCAEVTSEYAKTFYLGTQLMTPQQAKAIWAIYVWCRRTDELVDGPNASRITPKVRTTRCSDRLKHANSSSLWYKHRTAASMLPGQHTDAAVCLLSVGQLVASGIQGTAAAVCKPSISPKADGVSCCVHYQGLWIWFLLHKHNQGVSSQAAVTLLELHLDAAHSSRHSLARRSSWQLKLLSDYATASAMTTRCCSELLLVPALH